MSVNIKIDDSEVRAALNKMSNATKMQSLSAAAMAGAMVIRNEAVRLVPKKTGNLARSIAISPQVMTPNKVTVAVGTSVIYAKQVEYGGVIVPKKARFLAWQYPNGEWAFARRVVQPARPYMRPAFATKSAEARAVAFEAIIKLAGLS